MKSLMLVAASVLLLTACRSTLCNSAKVQLNRGVIVNMPTNDPPGGIGPTTLTGALESDPRMQAPDPYPPEINGHYKLTLANLPKTQADFEEPASTSSVFIVQCPECKEVQFMMPKLILSTGGRAETNGTIAWRTLYFRCHQQDCKDIFTTTDEIWVPPVKSVRVR